MHKPLIDPILEYSYMENAANRRRSQLRRERLRWLLAFALGMAVTLAGFLVARMFR